MKRLLAVSALTALGLAPAIGMACEYTDAAASASTAPPVLASSSPPAAATRVPAIAPAVAKATLPAKAVKPTTDPSEGPGARRQGCGAHPQLGPLRLQEARLCAGFFCVRIRSEADGRR